MSILKDNNMQKSLESNGYVVLNLLNQNEIEMYKGKYKEFKSQLPLLNGIHITMEHAKKEIRNLVAKELVKLSYEIVACFFRDFKLFQGSFIVKQKKSDNNTVFPHQDWSFVDEYIGFSSYTLWIALTDVNKKNGAIQLIPKSHHLNQVRYSPNEVYDGHERVIEWSNSFAYKTIKLKAGQAILWDHRLIHKSNPNSSDNDRLNITLGITHKKAQLYSFWENPQTKEIMKIKVDKEFYYRNNSTTLYQFYLNNEIPK